MTKSEFAAGISDLRLAFNLDPVRPQVLGAWYRYGMAEILPAEWSSICTKIVLGEDRFPANIVRVIHSHRNPKSHIPVIERPADMTDEEIAENKRNLAKLIAGMGD